MKRRNDLTMEDRYLLRVSSRKAGIEKISRARCVETSLGGRPGTWSF